MFIPSLGGFYEWDREARVIGFTQIPVNPICNWVFPLSYMWVRFGWAVCIEKRFERDKPKELYFCCNLNW